MSQKTKRDGRKRAHARAPLAPPRAPRRPHRAARASVRGAWRGEEAAETARGNGGGREGATQNECKTRASRATPTHPWSRCRARRTRPPRTWRQSGCRTGRPGWVGREGEREGGRWRAFFFFFEAVFFLWAAATARHARHAPTTRARRTHLDGHDLAHGGVRETRAGCGVVEEERFGVRANFGFRSLSLFARAWLPSRAFDAHRAVCEARAHTRCSHTAAVRVLGQQNARNATRPFPQFPCPFRARPPRWTTRWRRPSGRWGCTRLP